MPKSIRDGAQMSRVLAQVLSQRDWNLCNRKTDIRKTADHLCGKFHASALESCFQSCRSGYASQTAVEIGKIYPKSASSQPGQKRYTQIMVAEGHGSRSNVSAKTVSHHQVPALVKPFQNRVQSRKIIAAIAVSYDDIPAFRRSNSAPNGIPIALFRNRDHPCTGGSCQFRGSIGAAVIRNQNLSQNLSGLQIRRSFLNAGSHRGSFIQAGHQDRQFHAERPLPFFRGRKLMARAESTARIVLTRAR